MQIKVLKGSSQVVAEYLDETGEILWSFHKRLYSSYLRDASFVTERPESLKKTTEVGRLCEVGRQSGNNGALLRRSDVA